MPNFLPREPHRLDSSLSPNRELAVKWESFPHLTRSEADDFAADIEAARRSLPPPDDRDPVSR